MSYSRNYPSLQSGAQMLFISAAVCTIGYGFIRLIDNTTHETSYQPIFQECSRQADGRIHGITAYFRTFKSSRNGWEKSDVHKITHDFIVSSNTWKVISLADKITSEDYYSRHQSLSSMTTKNRDIYHLAEKKGALNPEDTFSDKQIWECVDSVPKAANADAIRPSRLAIKSAFHKKFAFNDSPKQ